MTAATQPAPGGPLHPGPVAVPAGLPRQVARFAAIGVVSTLAYLALFWLLRPALGPQLANVICLTTTVTVGADMGGMYGLAETRQCDALVNPRQ